MSRSFKVRRGYRVCRVCGSEIQSLYRDIYNDGGVSYKLGEWISPAPECGPLTCLRSMRAGKFLRGNSTTPSIALFVCEYVPAEGVTVWSVSMGRREEKGIRYLEDINDDILLPGQTVLAEKVRLIARLW